MRTRLSDLRDFVQPFSPLFLTMILGRYQMELNEPTMAYLALSCLMCILGFLIAPLWILIVRHWFKKYGTDHPGSWIPFQTQVIITVFGALFLAGFGIAGVVEHYQAVAELMLM